MMLDCRERFVASGYKSGFGEKTGVGSVIDKNDCLMDRMFRMRKRKEGKNNNPKLVKKGRKCRQFKKTRDWA